MVLKNCDLDTFFKRIKNCKLVCYGIGHDFEQFLKNYGEYPWESKISYLIDNADEKQEKIINIKGEEFAIKSFEKVIDKLDENTVILITCSAYYEIIMDLMDREELKSATCYIYNFMLNLSSQALSILNESKDYVIPKKIHYCWFGGNELPDLYRKCIDSWKKFCPDYEIIEWNETNCDIKENSYAFQAYECKKYGFVPDYFRLKIIYEHGGIYLDTDVELIKNLDPLRCNNGFCGLQLPGQVALGLGFGAVKGNRVIKMLLDRYDNISFINSDGSLNETISPVYQTEDLMKIGMKYGNKLQKLEGMVIYPTEVLSPKNLYTNMTETTKNTYAIHHFDGSWVSGERLHRKEKRWREATELENLFVE